MKKVRILVSAILASICLFGMSGCSKVPEVQETESSTLQTETSSEAPIPESTETLLPTITPTLTPSPKPTATLPPDIREVARFQADLDGDGGNETILVYIVQEYEDFFDGIFAGVLSKSAYEEILVGEGSFAGAYFIHTPSGALCTVISCDNAVNNQGGTTLCSFNGLLPELKGWTAGVVVRMDGVNLTLKDWTDFIGSWYYKRSYKLTDDFTLEPTSEMMIDMRDGEPLHTIHELPVEMLVNGVYVTDMIPANTLIYPFSADGEGHMTFKLENDTEGRITFSTQDYVNYIDGIEENSYFDNVNYWS